MGRRDNGEGTIYKVKDKDLYAARFYVDLPDGTSKRKTLYAKTRKEAADKMADAIGEASKGVYTDDEKLTVSQWMERWLEDTARGDLAHRT